MFTELVRWIENSSCPVSSYSLLVCFIPSLPSFPTYLNLNVLASKEWINSHVLSTSALFLLLTLKLSPALSPSLSLPSPWCLPPCGKLDEVFTVFTGKFSLILAPKNPHLPVPGLYIAFVISPSFALVTWSIVWVRREWRRSWRNPLKKLRNWLW